MSENKKYVPPSLSSKDKAKQRKILKERKTKAKKGVYIQKKLDPKKKPKQSSFTTRFKKKYKLSSYSLTSISRATGIPIGALRAVKKKGLGAYYSSGSRPNVTAQQWAQARIYSYILGGGARKADKAITKKFNVKFR